MDVNQIEVKEFIEISTEVDIENAKQVLRRNGYYVDNLWQTCDVTMNYDCTEEQAQEVLDGAMNNDATYQQIWEGIRCYAENLKLSSL
jgi:hypothetical protein